MFRSGSNPRLPFFCSQRLQRLSRPLCLAAGLVLAACGGPATKVAGESEPIPGLLIIGTSFEFDHAVGETECPQELGEIEIRNDTGEDLTVEQIGQALQINLDPLMGTIPNAGVLTIKVAFNCSQASSFDIELMLDFKDAMGNSVAMDTITIDGNVE